MFGCARARHMDQRRRRTDPTNARPGRPDDRTRTRAGATYDRQVILPAWLLAVGLVLGVLVLFPARRLQLAGLSGRAIGLYAAALWLMGLSWRSGRPARASWSRSCCSPTSRRSSSPRPSGSARFLGRGEPPDPPQPPIKNVTPPDDPAGRAADFTHGLRAGLARLTPPPQGDGRGPPGPSSGQRSATNGDHAMTIPPWRLALAAGALVVLGAVGGGLVAGHRHAPRPRRAGRRRRRQPPTTPRSSTRSA